MQEGQQVMLRNFSAPNPQPGLEMLIRDCSGAGRVRVDVQSLVKYYEVEREPGLSDRAVWESYSYWLKAC